MPEYWVQAWYNGKVVEAEYACKRHLEAWVSTLLRLNDGVEIQKARRQPPPVMARVYTCHKRSVKW